MRSVKIVVLSHSGYGHTLKIAEAVALGTTAIWRARRTVTAEEAPADGASDGADAIVMAPHLLAASHHSKRSWMRPRIPICREALGGKVGRRLHQWRALRRRQA